MRIFEKIAFMDDEYETTPNGIAVIGKVCDGTHIDCNATVAENTLVPAGTKAGCGIVYKRDEIKPEDFFFYPKRWQEHLMTLTVRVPKGGPETIKGNEYSFEERM